MVTRRYVVSPAGRKAQKAARKRAAATRKKRGNYGHSDATRQRLAEATARNIASGKIARVSKIEDVVAKELSALGVDYQRQVGIRGAHGRFAACVDFLLAGSIVLEVNGTFWHADPRFYPDRERLAPAQLRTVERYARKIEMLRKAGLQLLEVWEADLRKSPQHAVREVLRGLV
ncbi:MAG TPA: hypothetical protein DCY40_05030 [Actinobacteria bacterium]|nr:hypothetical protein [Actinomycetota bacterium]